MRGSSFQTILENVLLCQTLAYGCFSLCLHLLHYDGWTLATHRTISEYRLVVLFPINEHAELCGYTLPKPSKPTTTASIL